MNSKSVKIWLLRMIAVFVFVILGITIISGITIMRGVDQAYGGQTTAVDYRQFQADAVLTAITGVNVLSSNGMAMLPNRTVVLDAGKIVSIAEAGSPPSEAVLVDGRGKYLIPGLVDSHVHLQRSPNDLLLYVANGVTHIRDMAGSNADVRLRNEIQQGRIGPEVFVTAPTLNTASLPVAWLADLIFSSHTTQNVDQAVSSTHAFASQGYDGLKLYEFLDLESFDAVTRVAKEIGIPTIGHLPPGFELNQLRKTKLSELAHIEEIVQALLEEFGDFDSQGADKFKQFVRRRSDRIAADMAFNNVAVQSVLWYMESLERQVFDLESLLREIELEYANPGCVEGIPFNWYGLLPSGWLPGQNKFQPAENKSLEDLRLDAAFWTARKEAHHILIEAMLKHGVQILAGTDANSNMVVPGFSMHDELQSLNQAGLSPAQSLYAATGAPADLLHRNAGKIEPDRRADLLLLSANPLEDIKNTSAIDAVILNGRFLDRTLLDDMLNAVLQANNQSRKVSIERYQ